MGYPRLGDISENQSLPSESRRERVSQRHAESCGSRRAELLIVANEIKIGFGADEEVAMKIVAQARAEMTHEVIAADKVSATDRAATGESLVKAEALPSDASRKLASGVLAQLRNVDPVKIVEKRTIGREPGVEILAGSPGQFATYSELPLKKNIRAEHRVGSAGERHRCVVSGSVRRRGRRERAYTKSRIELLRMNRALNKEKKNQHCH